MEPISLQFIAKSCAGRLHHSRPDALVSRVWTDSRSVQKGDLFLALKGERFDGHDFLTQVTEAGATAILAEERHAARFPANIPIISVKDSRRALLDLAAAYRKQFSIPVIAVCGSNGKTTTKELIASVLRETGPVLASEASFNNDIGVPLTLLRMEKTHRAAVVEAGTNHPGELAPLLKLIQPKIGVLTSIGREHLEFFGDLDGVVKEEGMIAEALPKDGSLVINAETTGLGEILIRAKSPAVLVGLEGDFGFSASGIVFSENGMRFHLRCVRPELDGECQIGLLGRHQVVNALLSIAVGAGLGLNREQILRGLAACAPVKMRLQWETVGGVRVLNDAYNANADSMIAALQTLAGLPTAGRRVAVLGDMGELGAETANAHEEVGRQAAAVKPDWLVCVGRNAAITADSAKKWHLQEKIDVVAEVGDAAELLRRGLRRGDVVLLKASRSARLERILETLRKEPAEPALAT
jgi:UDP-N-acetylmuramoyl-tripeptide--D-alanyl-D-alanine ligase